MTTIHNTQDTELRRGEVLAEVVQKFLTHEYFVCYDPYSWLVYMAAQLGCIPIVHPMPNMSKYQWLMSTNVGQFLLETGRTDFPGIAYGWDEVSCARRTLGDTRQVLYAFKSWGLGTVRRMVRDVKHFMADDFSRIEGALPARFFYPLLASSSQD
jgi:hypothetical protein